MKKRIALEVPLTPQVIAILEQMLTITGNREFVFPSDRNPLRHINEQTANMALKRMGYENRLVAHDMRALASTTLNEADNGFDKDVIEARLHMLIPIKLELRTTELVTMNVELSLCFVGAAILKIVQQDHLVWEQQDRKSYHIKVTT